MSVVSILDFIPPTEHAAIQTRTSTTDLATYVATAIAAINSRNGGDLYWPQGTYKIGSPIALCRNLRMWGAGMYGTTIEFTHAGNAGLATLGDRVRSGSGFTNIEAINGSHRSFISLSDMLIQNLNASNLGACFYDQCSTYLMFERVEFLAGKYGMICDQTEVSRWTDCLFEGQVPGGSGLWIVNGGDLNPAAQGGFSNQLVFANCHFNQNPGTYSILDDGGVSHTFISPNVNGGACRFAGAAPMIVSGGEFESVTGAASISFHATTLSGVGVGSCFARVDGSIIAATVGQAAIAIFSATSLSFNDLSLSVATGGGAIIGAANAYTIHYENVLSAYAAVPVFDSYATLHEGNGTIPIRAESSVAVTGTMAHAKSHVRLINGSAVTYTVPPNSAVPFAVGTWIELEQGGAGTITATPGPGVTLQGTLTTSAQYQQLRALKTAADTWLLLRMS